MKLLFSTILILGLLSYCHGSDTIPLKLANPSEPDGWKHLAFGGSKPHRVSQTSEGGLKISVNQSAGPLIYRFPATRAITGIKFSGVTDGMIAIPQGQKQGSSGKDDFVLRLGLITAGNRKLNRVQAALAPGWIKELSSLSPNQKSLGKILFFNVENHPGANWKNRTHPDSKGLINEKIVSSLDKAGPIKFDVTLEQSQNVIGLWIACDGDDTDSRFNLVIDQIQVCGQ